jgi:hypothetical protein
MTKPIEAKRKKTAQRTEIRDEIGTTLQNSSLYDAVEYSLGFEIEEPPPSNRFPPTDEYTILRTGLQSFRLQEAKAIATV